MSASLQSEEKNQKVESRLLLDVFVVDGHQSSAILGTSSLTCGGSINFINSCGSEGGRCPWELLAAFKEEDGDSVFHIELGINESDGGVQRRSDGTSSLSARA